MAFTATDDSSCSPSSSCIAGVLVLDTVAPAITCPADIAVDPVSPQGTQVSFAATAADVCDPSAQAVCPDSGSTFGVGTVTVVTCTSADASGNQQSCDLEVTVYSPQQVIANLEAAVNALAGTLNPGQANSLQAHLANILTSINSGKQNPACVQLQSFIQKVEQLMDQGALTPAEGDPLLQSAHNLRGTLSC